MDKTGNHWDESAKIWTGGEIRIPGLQQNESLGVIRHGNGLYEFFTAGMNIVRDNNAYEVWKDSVVSSDYNVINSASVSFYKRNLFTGQTDEYQTPYAWASIDKGSGDDNTVTKKGHKYLGNTLVSEYFKMHLVASNDYCLNNFGVPTVGVYTDSYTLGGDQLAKGGWRIGYSGEARWLMHPFGTTGLSLGCIGPMSNDGVGNWNVATFQNSGAWNYTQMLNKLMTDWSIYHGFEFNVHMTGRNSP